VLKALLSIAEIDEDIDEDEMKILIEILGIRGR
jgi:hypothetical protein